MTSEAAGTDEAEVAAANTSIYRCKGGERLDGKLALLALGIDNTNTVLSVTDLSPAAAAPSAPKHDTTYRPTAGSRFEGSSRFIVDGTLGLAADAGKVEVITSRALLARNAAAPMWIRTRGNTHDYTCASKPKKLTVTPSVPVSLACTFSAPAEELCVPNGPAGKTTCLSSARVKRNPTARDEVTLQLGYTDFFGDSPPRSRTADSGSSKAERTKTSFKGTWSGNGLDLVYRGGITYRGTLTLKGETRPKDVSCNDLSMLEPSP